MRSQTFFLATALTIGAAPAALAGTGYVYANDPASSSYTPDARYSHNPSGGAINIRRAETGRYTVTFRGLGKGGAGGNVQVTAYGGNAAYCKVERWNSADNDFTASVRCMNARGAPSDERYSLSVTHGGKRGSSRGGAKLAYAWAGKPSDRSYAADPRYAHNPRGGAVNVKRTSRGQYEVSFANLAGKKTNGGNVQVTAYGSDPTLCKVERWNASGAFTAHVRCYGVGGKPADSKFSVLVVGP